ncbi:uncharacterized protein H6S33_007951 [Morchella sextelata]|uniref:uncharacterized protein n=1 Tax=Morchella sextelata TaxID=1174677 RepID=UPI001D0408F5|nr:uncharacterized protein H6S33_007951 [Morchella sextelata]KAH0602947.1 hypothetical protein H6S33_007951 [Morchella sextelata]
MVNKIDYSNAAAGLRMHVGSLTGSQVQLTAAIELGRTNRPNSYKARAQAFEESVTNDMREVIKDLDDYEAHLKESGSTKDVECKALVLELWEVIAKLNSGLAELEEVVRSG